MYEGLEAQRGQGTDLQLHSQFIAVLGIKLCLFHDDAQDVSFTSFISNEMSFHRDK